MNPAEAYRRFSTGRTLDDPVSLGTFDLTDEPSMNRHENYAAWLKPPAESPIRCESWQSVNVGSSIKK